MNKDQAEKGRAKPYRGRHGVAPHVAILKRQREHREHRSRTAKHDQRGKHSTPGLRNGGCPLPDCVCPSILHYAIRYPKQKAQPALNPNHGARVHSLGLILVFGTICLDRLRRVPHLPAPGGYTEVEREAVMLGGEAANTANALVNWGRTVALAGNSLGSGPDADLLLELLKDKGLGSSLVAASGHLDESNDLTPVCDVYVTPDGERTMFGRGFAEMDPVPALDKLPWTSGQWFTAEPNMDAPSRQAARAAADAGMNCYLMDFTRSEEPIAPGSFWQSSTDWAGYRNNVQKNVQWVKAWIAKYGCFTILSDGPNGFVAGSPEKPARAYPPYPALDVVDTTGAGDMFRAGMLFGLDQGWAYPKCLQFASAAGCLKCRALGATTEVPSVAEILAYVNEHEQVSRQYL